MDNMPDVFELLKGLDDAGRNLVIDTMLKDKENADTGLFLHYICSPLPHKKTGKPWPDTSTDAEYRPVWLALTVRRMEFYKGNSFVATEIKEICDKLNLQTPYEVLDWLASNPDQTAERGNLKSNQRSRKKQLLQRNLRAASKSMCQVLGLSSKAARMRLIGKSTKGVKGEPLTENGLRKLIDGEEAGDAEQIEKDSFILAFPGSDLNATEFKAWKTLYRKRYPVTTDTE